MNSYCLRFCMLAGIAIVATCGPAFAQPAYPSKNITLIVPFSPGGSTDLITRIVARELGSQFDKQVIADNRTGGGGAIGWNAVARAAPDGHTVLATELSFAIAAGLIPNLPFDPRKDFQHVTIATTVPHVMVITPSLPVKNVREFLALAKARPGELNYGSGGNGTNTHLGSELLKNLTGIKMVHIPYKGAGAVLQDLMGGQVQELISAVPTVVPYVNAKRLRALMVTDDKRTRVLPDVPSAVEAGLPKMIMQFWVGFAVPAGTPQPVVERLNQAIAAVLTNPDSKKRFTDLGVETVANSPAQATKLIAEEMDRWTAVIKAAGIKAE
ncbi:MAG: tripartite tricarboxylate transporter substrate binding protein [Burkholderiales bacterium]